MIRPVLKGKGLVYGYQYERSILLPGVGRAGYADEGRRGLVVSGIPQSLPRRRSRPVNGITSGSNASGRIIRTWVDGLATACVVDTMDKKGFIGLQVHAISGPEQAGKKVYFKNIRIRTTDFHPGFFPPGVYVVNNVPNTLTDYEKKSGWRLLFDGSTSKGWVGAYQKTFPEPDGRIDDGVLDRTGGQGRNEHEMGGDIVTTGQYKAGI